MIDQKVENKNSQGLNLISIYNHSIKISSNLRDEVIMKEIIMIQIQKVSTIFFKYIIQDGPYDLIQTYLYITMSITSQSHKNAKKYRIVFLGDTDVGKTSIIQRYTSDKFDQTYNATVGIDFNVKDITRNGINYRLQMWDTAGQQRYRSLIPTYLKNAHCVLFVFDVTKAKSLQNLASWHKLFSEYQQAPGIIVANKIDLTTARKVNRNQGQQISKKLNVKYLEVSAKTGKKIGDLFDTVIDLIGEAQKKEEGLFRDQNTTRGKLGQAHMVSDEIKLKKPTVKDTLSQKCCPSS